jgi:hypothetical protein
MKRQNLDDLVDDWMTVHGIRDLPCVQCPNCGEYYDKNNLLVVGDDAVERIVAEQAFERDAASLDAAIDRKLDELRGK